MAKSMTQFIVAPMAMVLVISGCMKPHSKTIDPNNDFSNSTSTATFYNEEVTGRAVTSKTLSGFSLPTEKLFNFRSCVRNKRTQDAIKGHKFTVRGGAADVATRSDESGCINWSEPIAYNALSDPKWLTIKRMLIANGMHTGQRDLDIAINPWTRDGEESVRDLSKRSVPEDQIVSKDKVKLYLAGYSSNESPKNGADADANSTGTNAPKLNSANNNSQTELRKSLWIDDLRTVTTYNPANSHGSATVDLSISMGPKILTQNIRGEVDPIALSEGRFNAQFWIVAKTDATDRGCLILANSGPISKMEMVGGKLRDEVKLKMHYMSTYGQLELVGHISAKEGPTSLRPFDGVWMMGDNTALLGMKFAEQRRATYDSATNGAFSAEQYISSCMTTEEFENFVESNNKPIDPTATVRIDANIKPSAGADGKAIATKTVEIPADLDVDECIRPQDLPRLFPQDTAANNYFSTSAKTQLKFDNKELSEQLLSCVNRKLPSGISKIEQFEFSQVKMGSGIAPEPIEDPMNNETTTERTIKFNIAPKVTNPLAQGALVRDVEFTIEKSDGTVEKRRTNHEGILTFSDKVHHRYFEPQHFVLKVFKIRHASGFSKTMVIVMNPWDPKFYTFARDLRMMTRREAARVNLIPRPPSELLLTSFNWGTQAFRYEVDNFLNLKMAKQFNLTLNPRVLSYSSLTDGRNSHEPLRDGVYLMKLAIQKDYRSPTRKPQEFITAIRRLVRVQSGQINTPVEIAVRDLRVLKIRSNMMIEIAVIDESKLTLEQRAKLSADVPLDSLIDPNSGMKSRTFIGPVVAYSNGFTSQMRPTDDLSEVYCNTIDCDDLKKDAHIPPSELSEDAKFFGSIRHLANVSSTQMIERWFELEKKYRSTMAETAKLTNFLKFGNYEYAAFNNEAQIIKQEPTLLNNNAVLAKNSGYEDLVNRLSDINPNDHFISTINAILAGVPGHSWSNQPQVDADKFKQKIDVDNFKQSVLNNKTISPELATRLCVFFVEDLILQLTPDEKDNSGFVNSFLYKSAREASRIRLNEACVHDYLQHSVAENDPGKSSLQFEHKLRVFNVPDGERLGGSLIYLGISSGSSFGQSKSESFSYGWSPTSTTKESLDIINKYQGVTNKVTAAFSSFFGPLRAAQMFIEASGVSTSLGYSTSKSMSEGSSVNTGQNIAVETRAMRLTLDKYERCASLRLTQGFIEKYYGDFMRGLGDLPNMQAKLDRMSRGLFICEGTLRTQPIQVDERYYQFSQFMGEEVMNDVAALENHPYLMSLRGRPDFNRFISTVEMRPKSFEALPQLDFIGEFPIDHMQRAFRSATPTFPGIYTIEDQSNLNIAPPITAPASIRSAAPASASAEASAVSSGAASAPKSAAAPASATAAPGGAASSAPPPALVSPAAASAASAATAAIH
jgi:hypothetical protein